MAELISNNIVFDNIQLKHTSLWRSKLAKHEIQLIFTSKIIP